MQLCRLRPEIPRRMGRKDKAVGFAVFLDMLQRITEG